MAQAKRRTFTAEYKQRILTEVDRAKGTGGVGALLRREGLYSSLLATWRRERATGVRQALGPHKRGPKSKRDPIQEEIQKLQKDNARLTEQLRKAEIVIDVQKKWARCWGGRSTRPTRTRSLDGRRPAVGSHRRHRVDVRCSRGGAPAFYRQPAFGPALPALVILGPSPARALAAEERETVRAVLNSRRFQDCAPAALQATLLDEGRYLRSTRTMYRVLAQDGATRERRDQLTHPAYQKPELLATTPNQLWSWDITKLRGPAKWTYFYLYVILDVFSRYVVGWMVAPRESAGLASKLIEETFQKQIVLPGQLTIHADRGSSMRSKPVALLLADLSITKTHSRPYTSNHNRIQKATFAP